MKSFSQITRIELLKEFGVNIVSNSFLPIIEGIKAPSWLEHVIENRKKNMATMRTEKSISEALIAPVLMSVQETYRDKISVFLANHLSQKNYQAYVIF